jgi:hypothetical protein
MAWHGNNRSSVVAAKTHSDTGREEERDRQRGRHTHTPHLFLDEQHDHVQRQHSLVEDAGRAQPLQLREHEAVQPHLPHVLQRLSCRERERQRERQRDRERDRDRETERERVSRSERK